MCRGNHFVGRSAPRVQRGQGPRLSSLAGEPREREKGPFLGPLSGCGGARRKEEGRGLRGPPRAVMPCGHARDSLSQRRKQPELSLGLVSSITSPAVTTSCVHRSGPRFTCLGPPGPGGGRPLGHAGSPHHASPGPTMLAFLCFTSGCKLNSLCLRGCLSTLASALQASRAPRSRLSSGLARGVPPAPAPGPRWLPGASRTLPGLVHLCDFASNTPGFWVMMPRLLPKSQEPAHSSAP